MEGEGMGVAVPFVTAVVLVKTEVVDGGGGVADFGVHKQAGGRAKGSGQVCQISMPVAAADLKINALT